MNVGYVLFGVFLFCVVVLELWLRFDLRIVVLDGIGLLMMIYVMLFCVLMLRCMCMMLLCVSMFLMVGDMGVMVFVIW